MVGIYKITNKINGKCYIGQSIHIERRWREHCTKSSNSFISQAIKDFGKENFSFEVIEECKAEELNEKEEYYINFYNSITPNGYNIIEKSNGDFTAYTFITKDKVLQIISDIKNTNLTFKEISDKFDISPRTLYYINRGDVHHFSNEKYPLREVQDFSKKDHYCIDCGKVLSKGAISRCRDCYKKYIHNTVGHIPITREELKFLIRTEPFTKIGERYNISDNGIRKWCKKMNLPYRKKDINSYSDEEWELI